MGKALELVTAIATAAAAAGSAAAAAAGNSLTVRPAKEGSDIWMLSLWADVQTAAFARIRSPRLHDAVDGIKTDTIVSDPTPVWPQGFKQRLYPNDVLDVTIAGGAVAGDIESVCFLVHYADLVGTDARLITWEEFMQRALHLMVVENTLALGAGGGYSGEEAINAEDDNGKANTEYALAGYTVDTECAAVRWRSSDTGNLGVGGPGVETDRELTRDWFLNLARLTGLALIPVFNFTNRGGILVDGVQDENGADTTVFSQFVQLAPAGAPAR